ncbi:MAG TPA: sulfatase-like hydrolase/transferase [Acidobacteriota bacterium]|nr:sulfatase-like hydrolase/transferase [Acidobacteriota bacterium]
MPPSAESAAPVVLITVDTWRADYWGKASDRVPTPVLDALAEDGAWFESAYCQVPLTPPSHASILTGTYPSSHGVRDFTSGPLSPEVPALAAILRNNGYQTAAFVSALVLDSVWGLDRGFDLYADDFAPEHAHGTSPGNVQRTAEETTDEVLRWLDGQPRGKPYFLWVHYFDPHHDYSPPEPFRSRHASDPYAGEVAYVDAQIGRLISALKQRDEYADSLIAVTSDHGESLGEHGEPNHGLLLYETTTRIPLIFKLPSRYQVKGRKVESVVESVDIAPTVLQALRLPQGVQQGMEGRGRLSALLGKDERRTPAYAETLYPLNTFGWAPLYALREGRYKLIEAPAPELYDLEQDPGETDNLFQQRSALGKQLQSKLQSRLRTLESGGSTAGDSPPVDPETVERLQALGYAAVSSPVPVSASAVGNLADPKEMLPVYRRIVNAMDAAEAGRPQQAVEVFQEVAREHPDLFIVQFSIGVNALKLGRPQQALEALDKARELNPGYDSIDLNRSRALASLGRLEEALDVLRGLVGRNPNFPAARHQLGALLRRQRQPAQAAEVYREILERRPDDWLAVKLLAVNLTEARQFDQALEHFDRYLQARPADALTANYRGIALDNSGRREEAVKSYRQALELKPDYGQARLNLSFALLRLGRPEEARETFQPLCTTHVQLCRQYEEHFQQ